MAVQIAKLSTIATLDSTQFGAGVAKMTTSIGALSGIALGAFNRIGAGVVNMTQRVLTALPRMTVASLRAGDELGDLATELGFTTEALSTLQRVAGLAGIEIGGVQSMVGKLNQTLGEAQNGNKQAAKSFEDLGFSVAALASRNPEDVFFAVLEALNQIPGAAKRSASAVALLGRGGRPALRLMGTDWAAERRSTAALGLAGRGGDVSALGRASDTLDDLRNNLKGFGDQLSIRLSRHIEKLGGSFLKWSKEVDLASQLAKAFGSQLEGLARTSAIVIDTLNPPVQGAPSMSSTVERLIMEAKESQLNEGADLIGFGGKVGKQNRKQFGRPRLWDTSGYGGKRLPETIARSTDAIVARAAEQMAAVPALPDREGSWAMGGREERIKWRIWQEMLNEMRQISKNTGKGNGGSNGGGARP